MTKTSSITSIALLSASIMSVNAFTMNPLTANSMSTLKRKNIDVLKMSAAEDEVAKLRAAAAKIREDAENLERAMGKEPTSVTAVKAIREAPVLSTSDVRETVSSIDFEAGDYNAQVSELDALVESNQLGLWKAAKSSAVGTNSPAPLRPYPVSLNFLETRTGGKITSKSLGVGGEDDVSLDDFKYATLGVTLGSSIAGVASLAFLPENTGAAFCYFFAIIPILFLGIGSTAPGIIAGAIASARNSPEEKSEQIDRICRHEAGHFLCGYLCGLPIKAYSANDDGVPCVEFYPSTDGNAVGRELSSEEISAMSVVALSGSVAEVLKFGEAKGGDNDLIELDFLLRRSEEFVGAEKQQDLTRWGALTAYNIITSNNDKFERLVEAFKAKKPVNDCIAAIEGTM
jgi:hypothetical protein